MKMYCVKCKGPKEFKENTINGYYDSEECLCCGHKYGPKYDNSRSTYELHLHEALCECGESVNLYTQEDNNPEYYTEVSIQCIVCKKLISIDLPVN